MHTSYHKSYDPTRPTFRRQLSHLRRQPFHVPSSSKQMGSVSKGLGILEWTGKLVPQGLIVSGVKEGWKLAWQTMVRELAPQDKSGSYVRQAYTFNTRPEEIKNDPGRYHLYLGNACPWCHRVYLAYALRGFDQETLSITQLGSDPTKARRGGWIFTSRNPDPVWGAKDLWEVYDSVSPGWLGRCTAPLMVDRLEKRIISNESNDIVEILNGLELPGCTNVDLRPSSLVKDITKLCDQIYSDVNNGVYRSGFSTSQAAYDEAQSRLFGTLDELEAKLESSRFLLGERFTQADLYLFPTVSRFDAVYSGIFRCSKKLIRADYPNIEAWLRDIWQLQIKDRKMQVPDTIDIDAACVSYYTSLFPVNPSGIVPSGPKAKDLKLDRPTSRGSACVLDACYIK